MITPTITSLVVDNEPPSPTLAGSKPTPPWKTPFLELLGLLKIIDSSQPTPIVNDQDQRFCFQPSHDLSEISRIFLSVSTTTSVQYDIDIKTIRLLGSDTVPPAVNKLQEYANHVLRRIQLFRDRLLARGVIKDSTCFLHVNLFTCPLCRDPLVNCVDCDSKVACPRPICRGSLAIDCEFCYEHKRMLCHPCLTRNNRVPPLICCPVCGGWCCREDTNWCTGLIVHPALGTKELAELSRECNWDYETIVRSHLPKPAPCKFCGDHELALGWTMCNNSEDGMVADCCPSRTPYMTKLHLPAAYCPECLDQSPGYRCACERTWICETCSIMNKSSDYPYLITCPRCGVNYCTGSEPEESCGDYIQSCGGCKGAILCKDCQEEEELPGDVQTENERPKEVNLVTRCTVCDAWTCADCMSACTAMCIHCDDWFCYGCTTNTGRLAVEQCPFCNADVCKKCPRNHQHCPGGLMLRNFKSPLHVNFNF